MKELDIIDVLNYFRQYGEIQAKHRDEESWNLIRSKKDTSFIWDFINYEYRIPKKYKGKFGDLIWDRISQTYIFKYSGDGKYLKREDYEEEKKNG